ncbi:hypothetical protein C0995_009047 [Termitomyces sp. Mi166|nr:hypothetical protein C0995_009047 [Termitomyces sp. Mi166\
MSSPTETTSNVKTSSVAAVPGIGQSKSDSHVVLTDQTNLLPFKQVLFVFSGLALCILVSTLDSVIVATALPTVSAAFQAGSVSSWVPSAYLLTSTCFQPLYGRFSDIFGRKAAFCLAMSVFMIGNLVAGFSRSITQLIVFRGVAGAGGGGIISMAQIVISDVVSLRERGKYQGIIGGTVALGFAIGPVIGGALSQKASWRWCFWIDIPVSFVAMCVVIFMLPLKPVQGNVRSKLLAVDYIGVILTLVGCALVILPLIWGGVTFPWKSAIVLAPLLSGFLVIVVFCLWEWKGARLPIVPMYIFKHLTVTGVYITMFINQMVASWTAGVIVSRTGRYRTIIYFGFAVWAIASGCLSTITVHTSKAILVVFMLLAGVGAGLTLQTTTVAAQASVSRKDMSVVTAFRNFVRLLGGTLTLAISSTLINNSLTTSMKALSLPSSIISKIIDDPSSINSPSSIGISSSSATYILNHGFTKGLRLVFILNAALAAVATVASVLMIKHKELTRGDEEALRKGKSGEKIAEKEKSEGVVIRSDDIEMGSRCPDSEVPR